MHIKEESPIPLSPDYFRKSTCYAGIGSRSTPPSALILIGKIAEVLADYSLILRSGGAPGADVAFEKGCDQRNGKKEIFLPWKGFNQHPSPLFNPPDKAEEIAALVHSNWRAVRPQDRPFHARNVQQVYGVNLDNPVDFVLFWAPEENGRVKGGTATAVHLAREMAIPTFNLWDECTRLQWEQAVVTYEMKNQRFFKRVLNWLERTLPSD